MPTPLGGQEREEALSFERLISAMITGLPEWVVRQMGAEDLRQEARMKVHVALASYDATLFPNVPRAAYVALCVRRHFRQIVHVFSRRYRVWTTMPQWGEHGSERPVDTVDYRREGRGVGVHPALSLWCSEEYLAQRAGVHMRHRIIIYLRCVEGLEFREIGNLFRVSRQRIAQIISSVVTRLAASRNRDRDGFHKREGKPLCLASESKLKRKKTILNKGKPKVPPKKRRCLLA